MKIKIIGCGTAGLARGITELRKGNKVEIFEMKDGKSDKVCGGICPHKALVLLRELCPTIDSDCNWIKYKNFEVWDYKKDNNIESAIKVNITNEIKQTDKHELLQALRNQFLKEGGIIHFNSIQKIEKDNNFDKTYNCSGAFNIKDKKKLGFAIETKPFCWEAPKETPDAAVLYDKRVGGYFWLMRCAGDNKWNIGVIGEKNFEHYKEWLKDFGRKIHIQSVDFLTYEGAYSTINYIEKETNGILNIGECAGLTTPVGFEGIYRSLANGIYGSEYDYKSNKKDNKIGNFLKHFVFLGIGKVKFLSKLYGQKRWDNLIDKTLCDKNNYYVRDK